MSDLKYCAFISYRHLSPDSIIAKKLHKAIETFHIPTTIQKRIGRKRMGRVFRDAEELPLCSDLGADIEEALDNSEWFIAICSPQYQESNWCMRELEYFVDHHGVEHVLPVLVDGKPEESFPELLYHKQKKTGENILAEPLAADVRSSSISKSLHLLKNEKLRLIASMLSVSYDDLKRRARQRKIRMAVSFTAATLAAVLGIASYVVYSNKRAEALRLEAEEQRLQAIVERKNAASKSIGELLEQAKFYYEKDERRKAAELLLNAVEISEANDNMRREEIISLLRRVMMIAWFDPVATLSDENLQLTDISVTPDECYCIGIENGNTVVLIDLTSNEIKLRVTANYTEISFVEFSPDGEQFLALCGGGRFVQVWNTRDGSPAFSYYSDKNASRQIANVHFWKGSDELLVQDWDKFYVVSSDEEKRLFYALGEQQEEYFSTYDLTSQQISFDSYFTDYTGLEVLLSNDNSKILISSMFGETGTIILDENGERICLLSGLTMGKLFDKYSFSPNGKYVSCVSGDGYLMTWNAETGEIVYSYYAVQEPSSNSIFSRIAFSPDGTQMAYIFGETLEVLETTTGSIIHKGSFNSLSFETPAVTYSKDGKYLFVTYQDFYVIDLEGNLLVELSGDSLNYFDYCVPLENTVLIAHTGIDTKYYSLPQISSVFSSNSFPYELSAPYDAERPSQQWKTFPKGEHQVDEIVSDVLENRQVDPAPKTFFSLDGETAAITYPDGMIELFRRDGDGCVDVAFKPFSGAWWQWDSAFAMNNTHLVASGNGQLVIYNMETKTVESNNHSGWYYNRFAFDRNGKMLLASATEGRRVIIYDIETGEEIISIEAREPVTDIAFSADGAYAVAKKDYYYLIIDMLLDETDILSRAHQLVETR